MSSPRIVVIGAGGHGRVVADALSAGGVAPAGFVDAGAAHLAAKVDGVTVLGQESALDALSAASTQYVLGVGNADGIADRERLAAHADALGLAPVPVVHPAATVSPHATVEPGAVVLAGAVVNPGARIARHAIVNSGAIVEHDAAVGVHAHVAPGAVLCGAVQVGAGAHVGAGAVVRQGIVVGAGAVIGAGASVVRDVPPGTMVLGTPARER